MRWSIGVYVQQLAKTCVPISTTCDTVCCSRAFQALMQPFQSFHIDRQSGIEVTFAAQIEKNRTGVSRAQTSMLLPIDRDRWPSFVGLHVGHADLHLAQYFAAYSEVSSIKARGGLREHATRDRLPSFLVYTTPA